MERPVELRMSNGRMAFGEVPEHIDEKLQEAVKARPDAAACEALLWEAHRMGSRVLPVFYALYKFYFNRKRFADAERVATIGLDAAAREGGYAGDWRSLRVDSTDWAKEGPPRFTLFTLKALAFISLRSGRVEEARAILAKLEEIDPQDRVGYGVIAALAKGLGEE
ncbi:hypothetical protein FW320_01205 [Azospirillum sp. Vi22]|uniref:hypothetical protein n=1 Tax=Azospirillum baldaniorum TaxID=1064539 RepID=UPI00157A30ED|nr:hypothetical protein [Azospirillum baldaniorum]NUB04812.1 hypothetical protein [Azospirillum baldaniorum]